MSTRAPDAAPTFSRRALAWIVGVAGGSFLLALLFSARRDELGEPVSAGHDSWSRSAVGHRAFAEVMRRTGHDVRRLRTSGITGVDSATVVLVLEPPIVEHGDPASDARARLRFESLRSRAQAVLVVAPKRGGSPDHAWPSWVGSAPLREVAQAEQACRRVTGFPLTITNARRTDDTARSVRGDSLRLGVEQLRLFWPSPLLRPVWTVDSLLLVAELREDSVPHAEARRARVLVLSDPDVLANGWLGQPGHAALMLSVLERELGAGPVAIDEVVHGWALRTNLLAELLRFPLVLLFGGTLVLAAFAVWSGLGRFGRPAGAPASAGDRRALVDSTAAWLETTGRGGETLDLYRIHTLRAVAHHLGLPPESREERLEAKLVEASLLRGVKQDLAEWGRESRRHSAANDQRDVVIERAMQLHRWREEMVHDD